MLGWHVDSVVRCGLAGTIFFTWTDEWFTGEQEITDWAFGLVKRDRTPKKSFFALQKKLGQDDASLPHRDLPQTPFVSVIVCSYNGGKTLAECLESLGKINYPAYEAILVDDGSTDKTPEIAARFPKVRYIRQENHGLSHARNAGAAAAKGEVLAYTVTLPAVTMLGSVGPTFRRQRKTGFRPASRRHLAAQATSSSPTR